MTAPNIEMIAALLRSCNLGRGRRAAAVQHLVEESDESGGRGRGGSVAVELNSETALPYHWEQCLDMRTGEVYYINRETGTRTSKDPRATIASVYSSSYQSGDDVASDDDSCSGVGDTDDDEGDSVDTASSCLTSLSSASPPESASAAEPLVSAGCRSCFMYFMVPKSDDACPKCGGGLLKLGRDGCA